jgi:hypothetical protein
VLLRWGLSTGKFDIAEISIFWHCGAPDHIELSFLRCLLVQVQDMIEKSVAAAVLSRGCASIRLR